MATVYEATFDDWVDVLTFNIPLAPLGKKSVERARNGHAYKNKASRDWEIIASVAAGAAAREGGLPASGALDCPLSIGIVAFKQRPKKYIAARYPDSALLCPVKPDADNVSKSVLDSLMIAGIIRDDCLVVSESILTCWTAKGQEPCVLVSIRVPRDAWMQTFGGTTDE